MAQDAPAGLAMAAPFSVIVQDESTPPAAVHAMWEVPPGRTRFGVAIMVGLDVPQERLTLAEHVPPAPVQETEYGPPTLTLAEPDGAFPVENPPPIHEVAPNEVQVRVEGTEVAGLALSEQAGGIGGEGGDEHLMFGPVVGEL